MRTIRVMMLLKRLGILLLLIVASAGALAQDFYVVIGTFDGERNARVFTGFARSSHYDADYFFHPTTKRYYVFVLKTEDRKEASELTLQLQKESEFSDAWLFADSSGIVHDTQPARPAVPAKAAVVVEEKTEPPVQQDSPPDMKPDPEISLVVPEREPDAIVVDPEKSKPKGKYFRFAAVTTEGREVQGHIYSVDKIQRRDIGTYQVNNILDLARPANPVLSLSCEIFGYNDVVKIIDYNNPAGTDGVYLNDEGVWIVPFELEPMKKGDVSMMNGVTFYKDAVIMLPQSKTELDELVNMMKSNPDYRIKIHGHNNGNEKNLRITLLGTDHNYFSMARSASKIGSGKELSKLRAETIQQYLADHGIDKKRTEVYAWGGMEMLAPQGSAAAARINNRIEIEILQD
jgi:outer membrane protein OmpA-like peptidoglycan-associated protein